MTETTGAAQRSPLAIPGLSPTTTAGPATPLSWQEMQAQLTADRAGQPPPALRPQQRTVTDPQALPRRRVYSFRAME